MEEIGKNVIIIGIVIILIGIFLSFGNKIPLIGKLPGDIYIKKENFSFYFPLATSILLSLLISFLFWIFKKIN